MAKLKHTGSLELTSGGVQLDNGQFYQAKRNTSGTVIQLLGYVAGTDTLRTIVTDKWEIRDGTEAPRVTFDTALGKTILDQLGNDGEILSLRSSDVVHGMTSITTTDTFGRFLKDDSANGGLRIEGFTEADIGVQITARITTPVTTKSAGSNAAIVFSPVKKSGTTTTTLGANENIASFNDGTSTRFILDADGDSHQDVGTAWTNFDEHDDVALLNLMSAHVTRRHDPLRDSFRAWLEHDREVLERIRLVTFNEDGHHFVNMSRLQMLTVGAVRQLADRIANLEQRLLAA